MRHSEPKIQELIEQLQGALDTLSCHQVRWVWMVDEVFDAYRIRGSAFWLSSKKLSFADPPIEPKWLHLTFAVNFRTLQEKYWDNFKHNLVQQYVLSIIKGAESASEHEVTYFTEQDGLSAE